MTTELEKAQAEAAAKMADFVAGRGGVTFDDVADAQQRAARGAGRSATTLEDAVANRYAATSQKGGNR